MNTKRRRKEYLDDKYPFGAEVSHRFKKWLEIEEDVDIDDALIDLLGDTYHEMRRLIAYCLIEVERLVAEGKYPGYKNGVELTSEQKKSINKEQEDLKEFLRNTIESSWRAIRNKQKIGADKLSISLKPYLVKEREDEEN